MEEVPAKRPRLDADVSESSTPAANVSVLPAGHAQAPLERAVGITEYLTPDLPGWRGVLKQRYTDFLVNEIDEDGNVVHLTNVHPPKRPNQRQDEDEAKNAAGKAAAPAADVPQEERNLSDEDAAAFAALTSPETVEAVVAIWKTLHDPKSPKPTVTTPTVTSREQRGKIHNTVRQLFGGKFETQTIDVVSDADAKIAIKPSTSAAAGKQSRRQAKKSHGRIDWATLGGEYVHFTLYKENRDTMEMVAVLGRMLKIKGQANRVLNFAGTKDRRACTAQRVSAHLIRPEQLAALNRPGDRALRGGKLGDFTFAPARLELGQLRGNEFVITLRNCASLDPALSLEGVVAQAVERVRNSGFANYFGLQRFGSFTTATSTVGIHLIKQDWKAAAEAILDYDPALLTADPATVSTDERRRAETAKKFLETRDAAAAAKDMPWKFSAESKLLTALTERGTKNGGGMDYLGALQAIPRNIRTMYGHAYQSLIFNHALSARLKLSRDAVLPGDLVLLPPKEKEAAPAAPAVDQNGEAVIHAEVAEGVKEFAKAKVVTAEDVAAGTYTFADVVLPTPGWDVIYPTNAVGETYKAVMGEHGLDPTDMRRNVRDWSLPGTYRKALSRFVDDECAFEVKRCRKGEQVVTTDLEKIEAAQAEVRAQQAVERVEREKVKAEKADAEQAEAAAEGEAAAAGAMDVDKQLVESGAPASATHLKRKYDGTGEAGPSAKAAAETPAVDGEEGEEKEQKEEEEDTVVVLRMRLGTSCYATMALRELMKDGVVAYKPEFGRETATK